MFKKDYRMSYSQSRVACSLRLLTKTEVLGKPLIAAIFLVLALSLLIISCDVMLPKELAILKDRGRGGGETPGNGGETPGNGGETPGNGGETPGGGGETPGGGGETPGGGGETPGDGDETPGGGGLNGKYLKVKGSRFEYVNEDVITNVMLQGVNVGDLYHFKKAYASGDIAFQPPDWSYIADDMNANLVRIATHPNLWRGEKAEVLAYLKTNVQKALAAGLFVIIDYHTIGFPDGWKEEYSDDFISYDEDFELAKDFWDTVSAEFTDGRILFELWNEPVSKETYPGYDGKWNALKVKWEELIGIIRGNNNNNVVLAGGDDWAHELRGVKSNLIDDANTAYTWHYYANENDNSRSVWEARLDGLYQHRPVVVTEWGFSSNPEDKSYYAEPQAFADTFTEEILKEKGLHHTAWGYDPFYTPNMLWDPDSYPDYSKLNDYGKYVANFLKSAETLVRP